MYEAFITVIATSLSKGGPVLLSVAGMIDKKQIAMFLAATAMMQIFVLGVGLGQTASLNIDFFKGKMLRHISLSAVLFMFLIFYRHSDPSVVVVAWCCACAQLAYQFIENRMKLMSLYRLGRQASLYMLLAVLLCSVVFIKSIYYRLIIQYFPLVVFSAYALPKYYHVSALDQKSEPARAKSQSFDYLLCCYALFSTFSLVVERQFYVLVGGTLMEEYFWAVNAVMIVTFAQDYVVKSKQFDETRYHYYGLLIILVATACGASLLWSASGPVSITVCLLLLYAAQNAFFSLYIKTRQNGIAIVMGLLLGAIGTVYLILGASVKPSIGIVTTAQWLAALVIGCAMVVYSKKGRVSATA